MIELPPGAWTGEQVKAAREALGMTQQELADALELEGNFGKDSVRNWEREKRPISGPSRVAIRLLIAGRSKRPAKAPAFAKADKATLLIALDLAARATESGAKKLEAVGSASHHEANEAADRFRKLRAKLESAGAG